LTIQRRHWIDRTHERDGGRYGVYLDSEWQRICERRQGELFGVNPAITPTSITSTQILATIPATDLATVGTLNVTVTNRRLEEELRAHRRSILTTSAGTDIDCANERDSRWCGLYFDSEWHGLCERG